MSYKGTRRKRQPVLCVLCMQMSSHVQFVRNVLTSTYLCYDPCSKKAGFQVQPYSPSKCRIVSFTADNAIFTADNFILEDNRNEMKLWVYSHRDVVLRVDGGKISLSTGNSILHTPCRTTTKILLYFQARKLFQLFNSSFLQHLPTLFPRAQMERNCTWEPTLYLIQVLPQLRNRLGMWLKIRTRVLPAECNHHPMCCWNWLMRVSLKRYISNIWTKIHLKML